MKIALAGNPNSGKTSIFNQLTGLNQKVGNYPGVTVDKKVGTFRIADKAYKVTDLPGTYSIYPRSVDEEVVHQVLTSTSDPEYPDLVVVVVDASNLERNLLLFTQIYDLRLPALLVVNMVDVAEGRGMQIDFAKLSELLGHVPVVPLVARTGQGMDELKEKISQFRSPTAFYPLNSQEFSGEWVHSSDHQQKEFAETRYKKIRQLLSFCVLKKEANDRPSRILHRIDRLLTHPVWGYLVFLGILLVIFQAIFAWAEWPMEMIDQVFLTLSQGTKELLPQGMLTDLIAEGIIPGLGGVVIFIPQIAILFTFIFFLEETGYMSRVVFIMDRLMRPFGLNGRSVVPLISGVACAIPAIMATRNIDNPRERLITILVTPLMSCSARLPVYTILIALVIPDTSIGPFNLQGITLMGLYLLGLVAALLVALVLRLFIHSRQRSFLIMELPAYKMPRWNNLVNTIFEKIRLFVFEAGKIILAISIVLWVMASYGPGDRMEKALAQLPKPIKEMEIQEYEKRAASVRLENSYIGIVGKTIEPVIAPLGYNWQIGIALITSFAAREVFVGTMATIYSIGEDFEENASLIERMRTEIRPDTQAPLYTLATGLSLMVFYAFAMQCMSTLAVVLRETKRWKWVLIQLLYMTILAYLAALVTYQVLT